MEVAKENCFRQKRKLNVLPVTSPLNSKYTLQLVKKRRAVAHKENIMSYNITDSEKPYPSCPVITLTGKDAEDWLDHNFSRTKKELRASACLKAQCKKEQSKLISLKIKAHRLELAIARKKRRAVAHTGE